MEKTTKVLIVDDDVDTRSLYAEALRAVNFDVREGGDGLEGLELATNDTPHVIVTGIIMPRMDGFQFFEALKKNVPTASVPVIFLSHLGREEDERRAKEIGAAAFLMRDMTSPNDMIQCLNTILTTKEYVVGIDPFNFDAALLAEDLDINPDFVCVSEGKVNGRVVLKLRSRDGSDKHFDAEISCV
ncbi:MAG: response regulator [Candidatus Moranbacteria bacterium]|nr:response regulator [Candidatus Moranbacteria bacterium]